MTMLDCPVFSVAPMMDWTDRPCRTFLRLLSRRALLYTEMVHAVAVLRGDRQRLLGYPDVQHPLALQLGGSNAEDLAEASKIAADYGYDEINLNVGCPSDRVQSGRFGACLMHEPVHVADLVAAMRAAVSRPVTVKCRIGADDQDAEEDFNRFIDLVAAAGCRQFIVHARKAWLKGLSPKENRDVPPLDYERVYRLKQRRPELAIIINGGISDLASCEEHLRHVDGVMLGRAAYQDPYLLADVDSRFYGAAPETKMMRRQVVEAMLPHIEDEMQNGLRLHQITRHMIGLYHGQPGARIWRQKLTVEAARLGADSEIVRDALEEVERLREQAACRV
jgi:tRNA-dihydrouridine synthase A